MDLENHYTESKNKGKRDVIQHPKNNLKCQHFL